MPLHDLSTLDSSSLRRFFLALGVLLVTQAPEASARGALFFNRAEGDFARVPHAIALNFGSDSTATFEFWMMPVEDPPIWHVLGKRGGFCSQGSINYQCARDAAGFTFGTSGCGCATSVVPPDSVWTHVALTCDGTFFRLYLDGILMSQVGVCTFQGENAADLIFGGSDGCGNTFGGYLDEVRIWNYARSQEDIQRCMDRVPEDVPIAGLVGCWHFDEPADDQRILDSSGFGNHGTLGGDESVEVVDPERVESTAPFFDPPTAVQSSLEAVDWGRVKALYRR